MSADKTRVLFVDDEPDVLDGLRNRLRRHRREWRMSFAEGADQALETLASERFDAVVTDMRMPGKDGVALLAAVKADYPWAARIVLSGYADEDAQRRALSVAHRYLSKPCDVETIVSAVNTSVRRAEILSNDDVRSVVSAIDSIASPPEIYHRLRSLLADDDVAVAKVAEVIECDAAMTVKLLQIANSAFFGLPQSMASARDAVRFLGLDTVRSLVLTLGLLDRFPLSAGSKLSHHDLHEHALRTGAVARLIASENVRDEAFTASILHDVGLWVLASERSELLDEALAWANEKKLPLYVAERETFRCNHADVGGYLLGLWGLRERIVDAVADHHEPPSDPDPSEVTVVVHVASGLAHELANDHADWAVPEVAIDHDYVRAAGYADRLTQWRSRVRENVTTHVQGAGL